MMKTILQIATMALLGLLTGLGVNAVSPEPLPLLATSEQFELEVDPEKAVTSSEIMELYESGEAIFIDARSEDMYAKGRIPAAFSLPYNAFKEGMAELDRYLPRDQLVVIYCDGADCHASPIVYDKLLEYGFEEEYLKIFNGGWNDWLELGGEVDSDDEEE
jgi:rhodanese-related sulfurtransferase